MSDTVSISRIVADVPDYIRVRVVSDGREMTVDVKPEHFALALTGAGPMPCIVSHRTAPGVTARRSRREITDETVKRLREIASDAIDNDETPRSDVSAALQAGAAATTRG